MTHDYEILKHCYATYKGQKKEKYIDNALLNWGEIPREQDMKAKEINKQGYQIITHQNRIGAKDANLEPLYHCSTCEKYSMVKNLHRQRATAKACEKSLQRGKKQENK